MPTYTYKREDGTTFDLQQKISADALTTCPTTGQAVKRVITGGGGVVYKGEGWYVTDYKNKDAKPAGSSPSATDKSSSKETSESVGQASSGGATSGESSASDNNAQSSSK
jgi:putative FmdB family regulatory protein